MKARTIGWAAAVLLWAAPAAADIYRWKDADGVMHFSNQPPPVGAVLIEKIEETPYDAEADRRRIEEERRLRLERQKLEVEERKADLDAREREARQKMEQAERRLQQAQQLEQEAADPAAGGDCGDDYYLRYGSCGGYPAHGIRRSIPWRPGSPDLYRGYYRDNNNLYYREPPKPGPKPAPKPEPPKSARPKVKAAPAADEQLPAAGAIPPPERPRRSK